MYSEDSLFLHDLLLPLLDFLLPVTVLLYSVYTFLEA